MSKRSLKALLVVLFILALIIPESFSIVTSSTGLIRVNSTSSSTSGQVVTPGSNINLYFGGVSLYGSTVYLSLSSDGLTQISTGDLIYSPPLSTSNITSYIGGRYTTNAGVWIMGNNWVNGTFPAEAGQGNYYIKAFDQISSVAVTDTFVSTSSVVNTGTLNITPPLGAGGASIELTGTGYPADTPVRISFLDPAFGWQTLTTVTANSSGQITFSSLVPDLQKALTSYDTSETYNVIAYRSDVNGTVYSYANFAEYARGIKTVGSRTANGLYGNGSDLTYYVKPMSGDVITISGKWFHPGVIYVRWDSSAVVGTVTSNQWANAAIVGTTATGVNGSFSTTVTIPNCAAGAHFIAIEDSQTRVIVKITTASATASLTPSSGAGGITAQLTGSRYPATTPVTISYLDPTFNSWNVWKSTTSDASGNIALSIELPDLGRAGYTGTYPLNNTFSTLSMRTEVNGLPCAYFDFSQNWRGLSQVGSGNANGLYGNGTDLSSSVTTHVGDTITIAGKWFHPGVVYVRFDGTSVVGTVTGNEWRNAIVIGSTTASSTGSFQTLVTIPSANQGAHFLAIEDSQCIFICKIIVVGAAITPTPKPITTATPTSTPTPSQSPIPILPPPTIDMSCKGSSRLGRFTVEMNGQLFFNNASIPSAQIQLSYSITGGNSWEPLTMVKTQTDGTFTAVWNPDVTGNYKVKAEYPGSALFGVVSKIVDFALTPDSQNNFFAVTTNSTLTQLAFNSTSKELSFKVSGPEDTHGYVDVYVPKSLVPDISTLKTYIDGIQVSHTNQSQIDTWLISFDYSHSEHRVTLDVSDATQKSNGDSNQLLIYATVITAVIATIMAVMMIKRRTEKQL